MSKYYQALSKIQTQYNEKLQKEAKDKENSVFVNSVDDKIKSYSNLEKTRDTLNTLRPFFAVLAVIVTGLVFYVGVKQGMLIKQNQAASMHAAIAAPETSARPVENATVSQPVPGGANAASTAAQTEGAAAAAAPANAAAPQAPAEAAPKGPAGESAAAQSAGRFTLQLVTYSDPQLASEEVARLKKKGYDAFVLPSGRHHQICINRFEKAAEVREFQTGLRKKGELSRYPGSYVREIPAA